MRNSNEKNLPTKQDQKKTHTRIQSTHGNKERKTGLSETSSSRKKESHCIKNFGFKKNFRLLKRREFLNLRKESRRFYGSCISIDYSFKELKTPKLGITVSKKFGNACARNYFKRSVREAFRLNRSTIPLKMIMQVSPLHGKETPTPQTVAQDFFKLFEKLHPKNEI